MELKVKLGSVGESDMLPVFLRVVFQDKPWMTTKTGVLIDGGEIQWEDYVSVSWDQLRIIGGAREATCDFEVLLNITNLPALVEAEIVDADADEDFASLSDTLEALYPDEREKS